MVRFIDDYRDVYGVEPICRVLPIAPSTYFQRKAWEATPESRSKRAREDDRLVVEIHRIRAENRHVYGAEKVWKEMRRQGITVARCRVERLMRRLGLVGVTRGRPSTFTTTPGDGDDRPLDLVNRNFRADGPNQLWVSDLTYVATWSGFAYAAFVVDVYSRRIVGWCVSSSLSTNLALDALEQALWEREGRETKGLVHHSDRGSQCLSFRYTSRLAEAGIEPSVGSRGDSYDNALAESIIGLYKAELVRHEGPWEGMEDLELATLSWVWWFNNKRLLGPIGDVPPSSTRRHSTPDLAAILPSWHSQKRASGKPGAIHPGLQLSSGTKAQVRERWVGRTLDDDRRSIRSDMAGVAGGGELIVRPLETHAVPCLDGIL